MASLITGYSYPTLESRLVDEIAKLKRKDPLSPICVIVPTARLRQRLIELLSMRGTFVNIEFFTFLAFSYEILKLKGKPIPPSPPRASLRLLLKRILIETGDKSSACEGLLKYDSFVDRLLTLFSHFTSNMVPPFDSDRGIEGLTYRLYQGFKRAKEVKGIVEPEDVIALALASLTTSHAYSDNGNNGHNENCRVILYGFYDLNRLQREIVRAIDRQQDLDIYCPATSDDPFSDYARLTLDFFHDLSKDSHKEEQKTKGHTILPEGSLMVQEIITRGRKDKPIDPGDLLRIVTAPGNHAEARSVTMEILAARENAPDLKWRDIGVVVNGMKGTTGHLRAVFSNYNIPAYFDTGTPLRSHPETRAFLDILHAIESNLNRSAITSLIFSDRFNWPMLPADDEGWVKDNIHHALTIARNGGVVSGPGSWKAAWGEPGEDSPSGAGGSGDDEGRFRQLTRNTIFSLVTDLISIRANDTPENFRDTFLNLLIKYIRHDDDVNDVTKTITEIIGSMGHLSKVHGELSLREFIGLLRREIDEKTIHLSPDRDAVFVSDVMGIRGLSFKVLIIMGMNEGVFPKMQGHDPLLSEETRMRLGLTTIDSRYKEERFLFSLLLGSFQRQLILTYQRSDDKGREAISSIFLRDILSGMEFDGKRWTPDTELPREMIKDYPRLPFLDKAISKYREKDIRVSTLVDVKSINKARGVVSSSNFLKDGLLSIEARSKSNPPLKYDGVIGHQEGLIEGIQPISPGRLETYADCPFRFFVEYILDVRETEEPEIEEDIEAIEIGSQYHRVLSLLMGRLKEAGRLPITPDNIASILDDLDRIVKKEIKDRIRGRLPELVVRARVESATEWLGQYLEEEALTTKDGFIPSLFEVDFGLSRGRGGDRHPPLKIDLGKREILLSGRPDRIDINEDKKRFKVIDYKRKMAKSKKKLTTEIEKGLHFQIPIYMMAGEAVILEDGFEAEGGRLVYIERKGEEKREEEIDRDYLHEEWEAVREKIGEYMASIDEGAFNTKADDNTCKYCAYRHICRK